MFGIRNSKQRKLMDDQLENNDFEMEQFSPDWQLIDEISIKLLENGIGTFETLQRALPSVVLAQIERIVPDDEENLPEIGGACSACHLLKLFRLAQLQIDYLLKSQQSLVERLARAENRASRYRKENRVLRDQFFGNDAENRMRSSNGGDQKHEVKATDAQWGKELFKCNECSKVFLHANFLADHILRKHHNTSAAEPSGGGGAMMGGSLRRLVGGGGGGTKGDNGTGAGASAAAGVMTAGEMMASGASRAKKLIRRGNSQQENSKKRYSKKFGLTKQSTTSAADYFNFSSSIGEEILDENLRQEKLSSESSSNVTGWR
ncbi:hypothetical protein niasHT_036539 [Heterodera trifolii]|uniref:C2H2-type domain-containing protein n=1 Tax=Heterodera trifolii TaxID=157864 RepID=A0ABD2IMB3_9BILA